MKVALVLPPFNLSASWGSSTKMKVGILPSLGVGYLAAALEGHGHAPVILDAPAEGWSIDETTHAVLREAPGLVGISCLTMSAGSAYALATSLKKERPDLLVVMGGAHVTAFGGQVLEWCPAVDVVIPGEAENTFASFVDSCANGRGYRDQAGVIHRDADGRTIVNPPAALLTDLDSLSPPARHLYRKDLYRPLPNQGRRLPATIAITSRGCPWRRCTFCYQSMDSAPRYRRRSPENVIEELRQLVHRDGYREVMFWDENFCINDGWIGRFCDLLDQEKLKVPWTAEGCVRTVTPSMLKRMARSGCYNIFFGIESGNQEMLDLLDKGTTLEQIRWAVKCARKAGLEVRASYVLGLPTETPQMSEKTIRFACELDTDFANFVPFHVWEGIPLEEFAFRHGHNIEWNGNLLAPSYVPYTYPGPEAVDAMVKRAYRKFYFRPRALARFAWKARNPALALRYVQGFAYWLRVFSRPTVREPVV